VALTQVTTALGSYSSYAGILQLLYYEAKTGKVYSLNAGYHSYLNETDPKTIPVSDVGLASLAGKLPGRASARRKKNSGSRIMAGIEAMHQRFGHLRFQELFQPAIWYAENGVTVSPLLASYFQTREKHLSRTEEGRQFIHQAGNHLPQRETGLCRLSWQNIAIQSLKTARSTCTRRLGAAICKRCTARRRQSHPGRHETLPAGLGRRSAQVFLETPSLPQASAVEVDIRSLKR